MALYIYFAVEHTYTSHDLTAAERDELGGVEYKVVSFLSVIVFLYFILFIMFGMISVGVRLELNDPAQEAENNKASDEALLLTLLEVVKFDYNRACKALRINKPV
ncbi:Potassium transporter [Penicillium cf. griseofulvum]|uniref:Potassium transporter n=1 Tax=Penicillium cf. griseofulvum TaxID=2972120 RepID=A0A9W9T345_9EURO|nr:Potassium transporter [Penicillium cf. griseofulvum]KAJ5446358.1 Potassium transporter [Penicillium cf. griseofulvum]KAJ5448100.1 Potassium transporter [Penicillium cf. griseofulvum]